MEITIKEKALIQVYFEFGSRLILRCISVFLPPSH